MNNNPRFALIYTSKALQAFDEAALETLAKKAKTNNAKKGITGYLNFREGRFFQFLQGEEEAVVALEQVVKSDPRHTVVNTLYFYDLDEVIFPNWNMAYLDGEIIKETLQEEVLDSILTKMSGGVFDEEWARKATINMLYAIKYRNQRKHNHF